MDHLITWGVSRDRKVLGKAVFLCLCTFLANLLIFRQRRKTPSHGRLTVGPGSFPGLKPSK